MTAAGDGSAFGALRVPVRDALHALAHGASWPFPSWIVLHNRMLDEAGGEAKPLVGLLVRAAEGGLLDRMPRTRPAWLQARGSLVLSLTTGTFLQPEAARWAVECWAYALGVIDEPDLTVAADHGARARAAAAAAAQALAEAEALVAARAREAAARAAPSSAPALPARPVPAPAARSVAPPRAPNVGARPVGAPAPSAVSGVGRRGVVPEPLSNPVARASLVGIAVFLGYVVYSAARMPSARATELPPESSVQVAPVAGAPVAAPTDAGPAAAGIPGVTTRGLPSSRADSLAMLAVRPARRPTQALDQLPAPPTLSAVPASPTTRVANMAVAPAAPPTRAAVPAAGGDGYDRLRFRDGRILRGRVELVRVSAVVFRDAETGLRYEYPKADLEAIVTEFGTTVRFSPAAPATPSVTLGAAAESPGGALVRRGVGGRYLVRYAIESINGSAACRRGWDAAPPPAWARVTHVPGADTLAITFDGGSRFASVIDGEAQFASTFVIVPNQALSGSALTTRLNGRFTADGFDAAVNLVGYRRMREGRDVACHTVLRAVGRASPAGS